MLKVPVNSQWKVGASWRVLEEIRETLRENTENEILPRLTEDQRNITPFSLKSQPILKLNTAVYNEFGILFKLALSAFVINML